MMAAPAGGAAGARPSRSRGARIVLAACAVLFFLVFVALGSWQVKRMFWKHALIERIDQRVHASPVPIPARAMWPQVTVESDEYRPVRVTGTFLHDFTTRVQTTTKLGIGFWLMTPLCTDEGVVFINRGFVAMRSGDLKLPAPPVAAGDVCTTAAGSPVTITGLLRLPEPKGRILRENEPQNDRWYTRDIIPMAAKRGFPQAAPFFIDAAAGQEYPRSADEKPTGGLTVIAFPDNHLAYALTWFALAAMVAGGYYLVLRFESRRATGKMDDEHGDT